jgi:hypothetical protein
VQNFTPEDTSPILRPVETFEEAFHEFPGILDSIQQQAFSRPSPIQVTHHRGDRVLSFFSIRWNWDSPTPSPGGECVLPSFGSGGGGCTRWREVKGGGGFPIPTRGHTWYFRYVGMYFVFPLLDLHSSVLDAPGFLFR